MNALKYPLTNAQMELMKLFGTDLSDKELVELKSLLSRFYADKATRAADMIWDKQDLSDEAMDSWLNGGG